MIFLWTGFIGILQTWRQFTSFFGLDVFQKEIDYNFKI
jgi:hypothetical protein